MLPTCEKTPTVQLLVVNQELDCTYVRCMSRCQCACQRCLKLRLNVPGKRCFLQHKPAHLENFWVTFVVVDSYKKKKISSNMHSQIRMLILKRCKAQAILSKEWETVSNTKMTIKHFGDGHLSVSARFSVFGWLIVIHLFCYYHQVFLTLRMRLNTGPRPLCGNAYASMNEAIIGSCSVSVTPTAPLLGTNLTNVFSHVKKASKSPKKGKRDSEQPFA